MSDLTLPPQPGDSSHGSLAAEMAGSVLRGEKTMGEIHDLVMSDPGAYQDWMYAGTKPDKPWFRWGPTGTARDAVEFRLWVAKYFDSEVVSWVRGTSNDSDVMPEAEMKDLHKRIDMSNIAEATKSALKGLGSGMQTITALALFSSASGRGNPTAELMWIAPEVQDQIEETAKTIQRPTTMAELALINRSGTVVLGKPLVDPVTQTSPAGVPIDGVFRAQALSWQYWELADRTQVMTAWPWAYIGSCFGERPLNAPANMKFWPVNPGWVLGPAEGGETGPLRLAESFPESLLADFEDSEYDDIEDAIWFSDSMFFTRFLVAVHAWAQMTLDPEDPEQVAAPKLRRKEGRAGIVNPGLVRTVRLRKVRRDKDGNEIEREPSDGTRRIGVGFQFPVKGGWQWRRCGPQKSERRRVYIGDYYKGEEGTPVRRMTTVQRMDR